MIQRLYDWTLSLAEHRHALLVLALVSFLESSVFPIPPDILMIPMIIARPSRAFLIATVALVSSVLGGLLGYAIGALAFDALGEPILRALGKADSMAVQGHHHNVGLDGHALGDVYRHVDPRTRAAVLPCGAAVVEIRRAGTRFHRTSPATDVHPCAGLAHWRLFCD